MGLGRFLNKQLIKADGIQTGSEDAAILFEGDTVVATRPVNIEGAVTATNAQVNQLQVKAGNAITAAWRTIYTWNIPAIAAMNVGSINSIVTQDVTVSGAAVGDLVVAAPIGSINTLVQWGAACYSATAVKLSAWCTGSLTLTPGEVPFKIGILKW